jgi:hypothetical protein
MTFMTARRVTSSTTSCISKQTACFALRCESRMLHALAHTLLFTCVPRMGMVQAFVRVMPTYNLLLPVACSLSSLSH